MAKEKVFKYVGKGKGVPGLANVVTEAEAEDLANDYKDSAAGLKAHSYSEEEIAAHLGNHPHMILTEGLANKSYVLVEQDEADDDSEGDDAPDDSGDDEEPAKKTASSKSKAKSKK